MTVLAGRGSPLRSCGTEDRLDCDAPNEGPIDMDAGRRILRVAAVSCIVIALANDASAEEPAPGAEPEAQASASTEIDTIVVTSRRRPEELLRLLAGPGINCPNEESWRTRHDSNVRPQFRKTSERAAVDVASASRWDERAPGDSPL